MKEESRKLKQYGWISGPVECCCSMCDWSLDFVAVDSSTSLEVLNAFKGHDCGEFRGFSNIESKYSRPSMDLRIDSVSSLLRSTL